ncbi:DUF6953 family protein [Aureimonas sp. SK2]|uniref:DUF6953 family protein n=1 Tax=Aureimonas sp. SK2 TaxID=3015992 RepID=UPI0024442939|nr:hypothetical protein [Aureimonas sp. SK2]
MNDVAKWMADQIKEPYRVLDQGIAAYRIRDDFGSDFTYLNANGNLAIAQSVLKEFNKITAKDVVWSRSERHWRLRRDHDLPGRQQP